MDGFDDDEAKSECDEGCEVPVRFLATERNSLEALELAHKLLDTGAGTQRRRHWLARFRRRSIVVSKAKRMVDVSIALFARFAGNNRIAGLISMLA